jgi:uncharacterized membrane protein
MSGSVWFVSLLFFPRLLVIHLSSSSCHVYTDSISVFFFKLIAYIPDFTYKNAFRVRVNLIKSNVNKIISQLKKIIYGSSHYSSLSVTRRNS